MRVNLDDQRGLELEQASGVGPRYIFSGTTPMHDVRREDGPNGEAFEPHAGAQYNAEHAELDWVLSHPEIKRSTNLVRFLTYICKKYFDGESDEIRELSIATEALGRKSAGFDSHADPIVRVTARSLRKKLQLIYTGDGATRTLRIELPLGHYKPQFTPWTEEAAQSVSDVETGDEAGLETEELDTLAAQALSASVPEKKLFGFRLRTLGVVGGILIVIAGVFLAGFVLGKQTNQPQIITGELMAWGEPVWSDEFDGAARQMPDASKWGYDNEDVSSSADKDKRVYCSPGDVHLHDCDARHPNAFLDGAGHLVLRAEKNTDHVWTLVRLTTRGLKSFQYGRIEARMKMPVGKGLWPSFLLVGDNKSTVGWPASGSIDVAENVSLNATSNGLGPTMIRSTLHGPRYSGSNGLWHDFRLPNGARVDDGNFHTYGIIWSPGMVQFYVDDPANVYIVHDATELPEGGKWVFDHPFYLLMSLAVGGDWAGDSDETTPNPADLLVDYVRVYKIPPVPAPRIEWQPTVIKAGASQASAVALNTDGYAGRVLISCSTDSPLVVCSLATPVLNFSGTRSQQDILTLATDTFTEKGRVSAPPGKYKLMITATTIGGERSELTKNFEVRSE